MHFNISYFFSHSKMIKLFYLSHVTVAGTTISSQGGSGNNSYKEVLHIPPVG